MCDGETWGLLSILWGEKTSLRSYGTTSFMVEGATLEEGFISLDFLLLCRIRWSRWWHLRCWKNMWMLTAIRIFIIDQRDLFKNLSHKTSERVMKLLKYKASRNADTKYLWFQSRWHPFPFGRFARGWFSCWNPFSTLTIEKMSVYFCSL